MSPTNWGHFQDRNGNCNVVFKGERGGGEEKEEAQRTYGVDAET